MTIPSTTKGNNRALTLDGTISKDVSFIGSRVVSRGERIATTTVAVAFLCIEEIVLEIDTTVTADEIHRTVYLAIDEVLHRSGLVAVIGVLIREQFDILADGLGTLILQSYGTCATLSGIDSSIVIERVLEGQILQIGVGDILRNQDSSGGTDTFVAEVRCVADDRSFHGLTDDGDIVLGDLRQHFLA